MPVNSLAYKTTGVGRDCRRSKKSQTQNQTRLLRALYNPTLDPDGSKQSFGSTLV